MNSPSKGPKRVVYKKKREYIWSSIEDELALEVKIFSKSDLRVSILMHRIKNLGCLSKLLMINPSKLRLHNNGLLTEPSKEEVLEKKRMDFINGNKS